jgi:hypothetical protein
MSRQEKGSRMRMLPPRVQLQQRDALTGSYPTNVRFSTDGRSGNYKVNFDDTSVVDFVTTTQSSSYSAPQNLGLEYSPLALYTFDGNINDQSGNSNNLSLHSGSLQYTDGPFYGSQAILFDGYNSLTSSIISALQITGAVTLQAFIKSNTTTVSSVGKAVASLAGIGESLKTNILYSMFVDGDNKAGSFGYDIEKGLGVDVSEFSVASLLQPGKWYHIAIARNGSSNNKLYLNGTLITSFTSLNFPEKDVSGNLQRLIVGTHPSSGGDYQAFAYKGAVSNLKIVDRELTANEIKSEFERIFPEGILAGVGFPIASKWIQNRIGLDLPTSGGISSPGNVASQVIENLPFFHFTPGQEITPFRDSNQPAVDGKSQNNSFFATGSSPLLIGEGFSSPLWSKNKIEIDISVATPCSATLFLSGANWSAETRPAFQNNTVDGLSYEMCYYNFASKTWQGAGTGTPYGFFHDAVNHGPSITGRAPFEDRIMFGFAPGIINAYPYALNVSDANELKTQVTGVFEWQASAGQPYTNFGFPYHPKYHATGSQTLRMDQYINQPFLLEKIVVELSAAYTVFADTYNTASFLYDTNIGNPPVTITSITQSTYPASVNNIFILNQRKPIKFNNVERMEYLSYDPANPLDDTLLVTNVPTAISLSAGGRPEYVNTVRDLITWGGITSFAANAVTSSTRSGSPIFSDGPTPTLTLNPRELMSRDYIFTSSIEAHDDLTPLSWTGKISLELLAKSPIRIDRNILGSTVFDNMFSAFNAGRGTDTGQISGNSNALKYGGGGRNALGINVPNGRNYTTPVAQIQENASFINDLSDVNYDTILVKDENRYRYNPYILFPTDELIIGWQQPSLNSLVVYGSTTAPTTRGAKNALRGSFSEIKFLPGDAKITLYGSYIREGKEYNDGTNQLLSSDSIHEVIE